MTTIQMTERQKKWFASLRANLEAQTGRSLDAWVEVLKACPQTGRKKQAAWLKANHGLGVNHASTIISAADPLGLGWDDPDGLRAALWKDVDSLAILEAVEWLSDDLPGVVPTQRKGYSAWSRSVQFAVLRPLKGGRALLGFKLEPEASARLSAAARKESWSERLTAVVELDDAAALDGEIARVFAVAAERG
jgi:hypothetical protein